MVAPSTNYLLVAFQLLVLAILLEESGRFTGEGWEQEDDITLLVTLRCPTVQAEA